MADDRDDSTYSPLPIAIDGVTSGEEYFGKPANEERAQALGAFIAAVVGVDPNDSNACSKMAAQHLLSVQDPRLIEQARELVVLLHDAFTGDVEAARDISAAVRGMRKRPISAKLPDVARRRSALVELLTRIREGESISDDTFIGELVGIDPGILGSARPAIALRPALMRVPTALRAAARLSTTIGMFGDKGRPEDDVRKLFDSATRSDGQQNSV